MHQLHMPLQSGSDRVLKAMRRSYRRERYLGIIERVRAAMPDAAISTDIIVGFPGETEDDFAADPRGRARGPLRRGLHLPVLHPPRHPGRDHARPGAARRSCASGTSGWSRSSTRSPGPRTVPSSAHASSSSSPRARAARTPPPCASPAAPATTGSSTSRRPTGSTGSTAGAIRPGDVVEVEVTYAAPHHLVADGPVLAHRRTRSGDAWEARTAARRAVDRGRPRHAHRRRPRLTPSRRKQAARSRRVGANRQRNHAESSCDDSAVRERPRSVAAGVLRRVVRLRLEALGLRLRLRCSARRREPTRSPPVVAVRCRPGGCRARRRSTPGPGRSARPARC